MIIVPDNTLTSSTPGAVVNEDLPPTYTSKSPSTSTSTSTSPAVVQAEPIVKVKPTNYLSLTRSNGSLKGTFAIDPSLYIPSSFLPPLVDGETEETRANLRLASKSGSIDADISIVSNDFELADPPKGGRRLVTMDVKSSYGSITTKLHAPSANIRPPFHLTVYGSYGSICLHIPRSFRGPVTVTTHYGSLIFSEGVSADLTTFSEVDKTTRCFVGDFSRWTEGEDGWKGDEVILEAKYGSVKIQYDDEVIQSRFKAKAGIISRLFRF